jgi:hypothetical protein
VLPLILYDPFNCNWTVVWVAIVVYSELQILSAYTCYCTLSVATRQWFKLQSMYTLSCKFWSAYWLATEVLVDLQLVATEAFLWLQLKHLQSSKWSVRRVATEALVDLQLVATKAFFVVATEAFVELQLKCLWTRNWSASRVAISSNQSFFVVATEAFVVLQLKCFVDLQFKYFSSCTWARGWVYCAERPLCWRHVKNK